MALIRRTQLFFSPIVTVVSGVQVQIPAAGTITVPFNQGFIAIECLINLLTADKEAMGLTVSGFTVLLGDNTQVAMSNWTSYGTTFSFTDPDGTMFVDPDPALHININSLNNETVYMLFTPTGITNAGATINGLNY